MSIYNYRRRPSREVAVRGVVIGGANPVRVQSMANVSTLATGEAVAQALRIAEAGGEIVRFTTQGVREASNMEEIARGLRGAGCEVPLVADVHFNPNAAYRAAETCDKVRINPGNFTQGDRLREALLPFIELCRSHGTAVRLGVNHGSLSPRMTELYGDTVEGMVESALEYLRVFREEGFLDVVVSIKASNVPVMVRTVLALAEAMEKEGMDFPLHLGVTEAGDGEDGRVKSAVGIGALLAQGVGDTIRVSLSEPPEAEIPVARQLRDYIAAREGHAPIAEPASAPSDHSRKPLPGVSKLFPVIGLDLEPGAGWHQADASEEPRQWGDDLPIVVTSSHLNPVGEIASYIDRARLAGVSNPFVIKLSYPDSDAADVRIKAGADFGALLLSGYGDAIWLDAPTLDAAGRNAIALGILQAARLRISKTEYIACPSCGRTLFDLPATLAEVRRATAHLKGLKIGVMGCIVNGPGEMADADYGYVGAGPGRVSLYKGRELQVKNIPTAEALPALIELIKAGGDWREP